MDMQSSFCALQPKKKFFFYSKKKKMSKLNRDILYLIFEELRDDNNTLHSCISVNKTFCKIIIPILWNDPWKFLKQDWEERKKKLLKVIISHLSDKSRNILSQY